MTDFLQRVSQAALGQKPAIQPLVGSQYAPSTRLPAYEMPSSNTDLTTRSPESASARESAIHDFATPTSLDKSMPNVQVDDGPEMQGAGRPRESPQSRQTLSGEDSRRSPSGASLRASEDRASPEGPTTNSLGVVRTIDANDARGAAEPRRELSSPNASHSGDTFEADGASLTTNSQPGVRPGSRAERGRAARRRSAGAGSASSRSEDDELLDLNDGKLGQSESNTQPAPGFDRARLVGEIEPARQRNFDQHVSPLINGPGLLDQTRSRRVEPRSAEPPTDRNSTSPENVIRVTIGRIDVRAVTPPLPPVKSSARPAPKLSLDEFLRQHNGRSR